MKTFDEYCKSNPNICGPELCACICQQIFKALQVKDARIEELEDALLDANCVIAERD